MFNMCSGLASLDLSNFNTENVTDMNHMFTACNKLTTINVSNFNTEKVTDMSAMFSTCYSLTSLDLSNFNTKNVTSMAAMFSTCLNLTNLDLSHFDMSHLTSYEYDGQTYYGKEWMCYELSITSGHCTITCPESVQTELENGTDLPTDGVTFTWVRP